MLHDIVLQKKTLDLGFLEYLADGVLILDSERTIIAVNSALERLVGWSANELIGQACHTFMGCQHPGTANGLCDNLCPLLKLWATEAQKQAVQYDEVSISTKTGERREVSASFAPLEVPFLNNPGQVNPPLYSIIVMRDITEQKRQERIKTEFIATASHQLRTPLASIKTSIGLLVDNIGPDFSPPLQRLLQNIRGSSLRMERLVNDLIELTNLQSGRVQLQRRPLEIKSLIEKAAEATRTKLEARQQTLKINLPETSLYAEADYARLSQVLGHLISNGSKFSAEGQIIYLSAYTRPERNDVVFSVRDEGIGIASDEQELIFEKFYQSQIPENSSESGGGLGLPLAKALVELNGGRLWLESKPGEGSTFYFSLPATSPALY